MAAWPHPAAAHVPRASDAEKVWALVRVWSDWAGDPAPEQRQRYWMDLIDAAQPARSRKPADGITAIGWPLADLSDQFALDALEVHRPVQPDNPHQDLPVLPAYVPREHDSELARVAAAAAAGNSSIAVLVGGSSTGKTRACWEALHLLRHQPEQWRLWHPIDPSRPEAALRGLSAIEPWTVVWLNEAQFYLDTPDGLGEQVAAGLRELLRDRARRPVLVLTTMWPSFWASLTSRPTNDPDLHAQARELLTGRDITVPSRFNLAQLAQLNQAGDVRLSQAAKGAQDGQIIQFLAGVPELLARYRNAPPAAAALIHAAMDARRLGMRAALPRAFLETAVPGYLTELEWAQLAQDWLQQALTYAGVPCKGIRGPVTRIVPLPTLPTDSPSDPSIELTYHLADYLDQYGRSARRDRIPPATFWAAAASHAHHGDLCALGDSAYDRGLSRRSAQLHKQATAKGDTSAATRLIGRLQDLRPSDERPARWCAAYAALHDPDSVAWLLRMLHGTSTEDATLLARNPGAHADLHGPYGVTRLLSELRKVGAGDQVAVLAARAAARVPLDDPYSVIALLSELRKIGAGDQVAVLAARVVAHAIDASMTDANVMAQMLHSMREAGPRDQVSMLAAHAAAQADLHYARGVVLLLHELQKAAAHDHVAVLAARVAICAPFDDLRTLAELLKGLREVGAWEQISTLLARNPAAYSDLGAPGGVGSLEDLYAVGWMLEELQEVNAADQVTALAVRSVTHVDVNDSSAVDRLMNYLHQVGEADPAHALAVRAATQIRPDMPHDVEDLMHLLEEMGEADLLTALADRSAACAPLNDASTVAQLLRGLRQVGAKEQVSALLARNPAVHVDLGDPGALSFLLGELREVVGAREQVSALLARKPAAYIDLGNPQAVGQLLSRLREMGAEEQVSALVARNPVDQFSADSVDPPASLLLPLHEMGASDQVAVLAARIATHASVDNPGTLAALLSGLRAVGAKEQAAALLARNPAARIHLENSNEAHAYHYDHLTTLLGVLQEMGADEYVEELLGLLVGAGFFRLFCRQEDRHKRFQFGREADGSPAKPWGWDDLELRNRRDDGIAIYRRRR